MKMNRAEINVILLTAICSMIITGCSLFKTAAPEKNTTESGWGGKKYQAYFTRPGYNQETGQGSGIPQRIGALIDSAKTSVDIAIYELDEPAIYNSLIRAYKRGVNVRFAGDIDNISYEGYIAVNNAGIPMVLGNSGSIMHNKYVIIDGRFLITGSMNFSKTGGYNNNENVAIFDCPALCAYYQKDFETMYIHGLFGLDKTGHPFQGYENNTFYLTNGDSTVTRIEAYFTPYMGYGESNRVDLEFMNYINSAQDSILFAIFAFTHVDIATAMINAAKLKNIQIFGVFDKDWHTGNEYSMHQVFINAQTSTPNIHVKYDGNNNYKPGNPLFGAKCHNKYVVLDTGTSNAMVMMGSYNFSKAASYKGNDENWLAVHDPDFAAAYTVNFLSMYAIGEDPTRDQGGDSAGYHDVLVNEVLWAGSMDNNGNADMSDKFVELKNQTGHDINISGWQLVGTTASSKYYRIIEHIFSRDSVIPAGGYFVLFYSTNRAFYYANSECDGYLFLYHPTDQNFISLQLKDKDCAIVDEVGQFNGPSLPGQQSGLDCSMIRIGTNGKSLSGWATNLNVNNNVGAAYRLNTKATPGGE